MLVCGTVYLYIDKEASYIIYDIFITQHIKQLNIWGGINFSCVFCFNPFGSFEVHVPIFVGK